ncbi:host cell division inhibitor Icd-like protein [[Haemophilus] felis]|uniref:Uncharacterized protein n=1 Tax=[Haemophilus] felis TaxID=123822 RepID=A0A1T0AVN5_9PAST|nr:host cell division inhibitor Icd-like protein [[Haemophilus] felis]OOS01140.1 hypothetical protein B0188_10155 [[Haemophilus] felis]
MQRFLTLFQKCDLDHFTQASILAYLKNVLAKSRTERGNSNNLLLANTSTPSIRAFFVRSLRTPKEKTILKNQGRSVLSMVGRNGQRLIVGCFPVEAVFHPVTSYRQAWKLAVGTKNLLLELSQMYQFIFASIRRTDLTNTIQKIRIIADSEQEARSRLAKDFERFLLSDNAKLKGSDYQDKELLAKIRKHHHATFLQKQALGARQTLTKLNKILEKRQ